MLIFYDIINYGDGIMQKKKNIILGVLVCILIILVCILLFILGRKKDYQSILNIGLSEVKEKIDNKEDFVLCVSRTTCSHCQDYKPKLKKVGYKYKIDIYYIDVDLLNDDELKMFKNTVSFDGSTPITIFFKNGEEKTTATRIEGDVSEEKLINKLKTNGFMVV